MPSDDRIPEEWHFSEGYSYTRTHDALQTFKLAEEEEDILKNIVQPLRTSARLPKQSDRRKPPVTHGPLEDDDDTEEDDDGSYNPRVFSDQMKNLGYPNPKGKRKAEGAPHGESLKKNAKSDDGSKLPKKNSDADADADADGDDGADTALEEEDGVERTGVLPKDERLTDKTCYVTFGFTSAKALDVQKELASKHANDVSVVPPPKNHDCCTYTEKLNEDAARVPNETGRALRSGKIVEEIKQAGNEEPKYPSKVKPWAPPQVPCPNCRHGKDECICHEALIPKKTKGDEKLVPSILPLTHGRSVPRPVPITASRTPSSTGKDREPTRSRSPMSPSPTNSQFSQPGRLYLTPRSGILTPSPTSSSLSRDVRQQSTGAEDDPIILDDDDDDDEDTETAYNDKSVDMCAEEIEIQTRWSHPINFMHTNSGSDVPCKFCRDFRYGIWGEVKRFVTVIKDPSSERLRFLEVVGDTQYQAPHQTRMCVSCALNRLRIPNCLRHYFGEMPTVSQALAKEAVKQVLLRKGPAVPKPMIPLCSLCVRPARIKCCSSQKFDKMRRPQEEPNTIGCGLLLCLACHKVVDSNGGKLRKSAIERYEQEANARAPTMMLRADAEFIFSDSLLRKAYSPLRKA